MDEDSCRQFKKMQKRIEANGAGGASFPDIDGLPGSDIECTTDAYACFQMTIQDNTIADEAGQITLFFRFVMKTKPILSRTFDLGNKPCTTCACPSP